MQIQLKQQHIEAAIKAYVAKAGIAFPIDKIDFTAGRGSSGLTATIEMADPFLAEAVEDYPPTPDTPEPKSMSKTAPGEDAAQLVADKKAKAAKQKEAEKSALATDQVPEPEREAAAPEVPKPDLEEEGAEPPKKASLFGG